MIRFGILGDIGSGKSHIAKLFRYPVFNADLEVSRIYSSNKKSFEKVQKILPKHFSSFPMKKHEMINAIMANESNLKKITKIIHPEVKKKMNIFLKKYKNKKIVILDIPLLLENKLNKKKDVLIFIDSEKSEIFKRLKKRKNFNNQLLKKFKKLQFSLKYKKKVSKFIIKNNFTNKFIQKDIKSILKTVK